MSTKFIHCMAIISSGIFILMTFLDSIVLGLVQGITEFVPVSSSGHLVLAEHFLGLSNNFTFGVLLNIGTFVALLIYFRKIIIKALKRTFIARDTRMIVTLILSVVPTFVFGYLFSDYFDQISGNVWLVSAMLLALGVLMVVIGGTERNNTLAIDKVRPGSGLFIGLAQVVALIPGTSRSGITILAGLKSGFSRQTAADFSFLMAVPTIFGAIIHSLFFNEGISFIQKNTGVFLVGNVFSLIFGFIGASTLIVLLKKYGLRPFGWYRVGLSLLLIILMIFKII